MNINLLLNILLISFCFWILCNIIFFRHEPKNLIELLISYAEHLEDRPIIYNEEDYI